MIKFFICFLMLISPLKAMDLEIPEQELAIVLRKLLSKPVVTEKTADQILAENQDKPEFMSCSKWLQREFPNFSEEKVSSYSFFPLLKEAMQLADFEVDTLEAFTHTYMETDMPKEQAQSLMTFRENSMAAKNFVGDLINLLDEKMSVQKVIETYLKSRFECITSYQAELAQKTDTIIDLSKCETASLSETSDPIYDSMKNGFLRSYNTKNKIIRELLYTLKNQEKKPLTRCLSPILVNLFRLSTSLHPFFNKENDQWLDQDCALEAKENLNFLGNAKEIGVNLKELFKNQGIKDLKIPKFGYTKVNDIPLPRFLTEGTIELDPSLFEPKQSKNKTQKSSQTPSSAVYKKVEDPSDENDVDSSLGNHMLGNTLKETSSSTEKLLTLPQEKFSSSSLGLASDNSSLRKEKLPATQSNSIISLISKQQTNNNDSSKEDEKEKEKIRNKHIQTIYHIFRPKGYTSLNADKIIKAWKHVLKDRGSHKENTGRSHQPLYATLLDGSKVVFGFFISSSYGPRYVTYIREAFDKIGFGRKWLEEQGYALD